MSDVTNYQLSLDLPAVHRSVRVGRNVLRHFTRMWGLGHREIRLLELVVTELLGNCIDHGGGEAALSEAELETGARMGLEFSLHADDWRLTVSDQGGGDPEEVRRLLQNNEMPDLEHERGRGLYLLGKSVDHLEVSRSADGRGLTMTASKRHGGI